MQAEVNGGGGGGGGHNKNKRQVCKQCCKASVLCICDMFHQRVASNKIRVTILQHPDEKDHHLGSARIALLGLLNVELITVPELKTGSSYRVRPKVPGSKRCGGARFHRGGHDCFFYGCATMDPWLPRSPPSWVRVSQAAALLFPSDRAQDIGGILPDDGRDIPDQLIVLDGTWSKARRIYMENPWLMNLPHYKLPSGFKSMYSSTSVRSEPRVGYLSTVEGIVYALKALERETQGLDYLLEAFQAMIQKQRDYMIEMKQQMKLLKNSCCRDEMVDESGRDDGAERSRKETFEQEIP